MTALPGTHVVFLYCKDSLDIAVCDAVTPQPLQSQASALTNVLAFCVVADWGCFGIPVCCRGSLSCCPQISGTEMDFFLEGSLCLKN